MKLFTTLTSTSLLNTSKRLFHSVNEYRHDQNYSMGQSLFLSVKTYEGGGSEGERFHNRTSDF